MGQPASAAFSVIIPVYGSGEFLWRAIKSIAEQISLPLEVIVVDDASPIPVVLPQPAQVGWPFKIRLIRLEQNGGGGVARNAGVLASVGQYIVFLDYDDMMFPEYIRVLDETWKGVGHDVGAITVGFFWCDENMRPYRKQCLPPDAVIDAKSLLDRGNFVGGCSVISVRRDAFMMSGGFPALRACQDWGLLLAIAQRHQIKPLPDPYVFYMSPTFNSKSITRSSRRAILSICAIYRKFDPSDRGRTFQNRSGLVAYHLMCAGRKSMGLRVIKYSYLKFGRLNRLLAKAVYVSFVPPRIQLLIVRLRSVGSKY